MQAADVLEVQGLRVTYGASERRVRAVRGVGFSIRENEWLGLVGESGSGKSTIAMSIMRLIKPPGYIEGGAIRLRQLPLGGSLDLLSISEAAMRQIRLASIAMVPQGSMNSLNPVMRIRDQIVDGFKDHDLLMTKREFERRVSMLLESVGLSAAVGQMYPHELSGGMKQRVCIAIAVGLQPQLIIADEPTSALDVVVQKQVMEMLKAIQRDLRASLLLIGHDMALMAQVVDRIAVMYRGHIVEIGRVEDIFKRPLHPYTQLLISTVPSLDKRISASATTSMALPANANGQFLPFFGGDPSADEEPVLLEVEAGRLVACYQSRETIP